MHLRTVSAPQLLMIPIEELKPVRPAEGAENAELLMIPIEELKRSYVPRR